jgi:hypothetical protein
LSVLSATTQLRVPVPESSPRWLEIRRPELKKLHRGILVRKMTAILGDFPKLEINGLDRISGVHNLTQLGRTVSTSRVSGLRGPAHVQYRPSEQLGGWPQLLHIQLDDLIHTECSRKNRLLTGYAAVTEQLMAERTPCPDKLKYCVIDLGQGDSRFDPVRR